MRKILINIDVPDLTKATQFYVRAFGLRVARVNEGELAELLGFPAPMYLLQKAEGTLPFSGAKKPRSYQRHWTPVHPDINVESLEEAAERARAAGAIFQGETETHVWGKIANGADPFGNGFCLIQFVGRGYEELFDSCIS